MTSKWASLSSSSIPTSSPSAPSTPKPSEAAGSASSTSPSTAPRTPASTSPSTISSPANSASLKSPIEKPILYISGITEAVPDAAIVEALSECLRLRPVIKRESGSSYAPATGSIEFETITNAEKAYAIANPSHFEAYNCSLHLHPSPPTGGGAEPSPSATPRLFKSLPKTMTPGTLFDLCRQYGPVYKVSLQLAPAFGGGAPVFKGQAVVVYYSEANAQRATEELHCADVEGTTIVVQLFESDRAPKSRVSLGEAPTRPSFSSPTASPRHSQTGLGFGRPNQMAGRSTSGASIHSTGSSPNSSSSMSRTPSVTIDPRNLFVKSLHPSITSQDLRSRFSPFGNVISAAVMADPHTGISKEFGFVSFEQASEAQAAIQALNNTQLGGFGKAIFVGVHEPKALREGRRGSGQFNLEQALGSLSTTDSPPRSLPSSPLMSRSTSRYSEEAEDYSSPPPASEHDRLMEAVGKLETGKVEDIVKLLEGERALCLFNPLHLKAKISDALMVLSASDSDTEDPSASLPTPASTPKAALASSKLTPSPVPAKSNTTATPPASPKPPASSKPTRPLPSTIPETIEELARHPAVDIINLIEQDKMGDLGVEKVDPETKVAIDHFVDGLQGIELHNQKQKLGDRLFKAIKALGVKGAPRITIHLLDTEELRSLAHLIDYPVVLKEKALSVK